MSLRSLPERFWPSSGRGWSRRRETLAGGLTVMPDARLPGVVTFPHDTTFSTARGDKGGGTRPGELREDRGVRRRVEGVGVSR